MDESLFMSLFGGQPGGMMTSPLPQLMNTELQPPTIPPGPVPLMTTPAPVAPIEPYRIDPMATTPPAFARPTSLGEALDPSVPIPRPRPAEAPGGTNAASAAQAAQSGGADRILQSLRGVQVPKAPEAQKVSTPHLPALRPIQSGGLLDLLASLGIGPQQALPGLKLPSTLGQALGGR